MLFPRSNLNKKYFRRTKYTNAIIILNREVKNRVPYKTNVSAQKRNIRRTTRYAPAIGSEEYFKILRRELYIRELYCEHSRSAVKIENCFNYCRAATKLKCKLYMEQLWGCVGCGSYHKLCDDIATCERRLRISNYTRFYFSQLCCYDRITLKRFKHGAGFKKNFYGQGAQVYYGVGNMIKINPKHQKVVTRKAINQRNKNEREYRRQQKKQASKPNTE